MQKTRRLTAIIEREGDGYFSLCPELDLASQGDTVEEARSNLIEAIELFLEMADASEIERRQIGGTHELPPPQTIQNCCRTESQQN
ncbi:type II toxin-antitoxin system HicB family antitoxin [Spirulina subsalsa]|uniref:type II toxin-antitoxin system HicB family antitoxin n=1 Tax=Spirulina subsalsa TaxID=54311 RepID=UPI0002EF46F3